MPLHPLGLVHGRFQVLHLDHMKYILAGKNRCERLVVGITNPDPTLTAPDPAAPDRSRPEANPLSYYERHELIRTAMHRAKIELDEFSVVPFPVNFPELYKHYVPPDAVYYLTIYDDWGRRKKQLFESLGLAVEVLWEKPADKKGLASSDIRALMADGRPWQHLVAPDTAYLLEQWNVPERMAKIRA